MEKYPIEIEISSYCWLRCKSCINSSLSKKVFVDSRDFKSIIDFLVKNKESISFIDISWIGDAFLHPEILAFLEYLYDSFSGYPIHLNFSQKGQKVWEEHIKILEKMKDSWMQIDIFIWIFSIREKVYEFLSWWDSLKRVLEFAQKMQKKWFFVSLELLNNYFANSEYEKFYKICDSIGCSWSIKNITNFWWLLPTKQSYLFGYNNKFESPALIRASEKTVDERHISEKCGSTPYISAAWDILVCSYLQWYDDGRWIIGSVDDLQNMTLQQIYELSYNKMFSPICNWCSLFVSEKQWFSEEYYISDKGDIIRDKYLVKIYPYDTAEDLIFLYYNDSEFIKELFQEEENINKHEKIDFLFIMKLCASIYGLDFEAFFKKLLRSWGLDESYKEFQSIEVTGKQVQDIVFIDTLCKKLDIETVEFYLYCYIDTYISKETFLTRIAQLMKDAHKQKNSTNLAYLVLLKDKLLNKKLNKNYGTDLVTRYYWIFSS